MSHIFDKYLVGIFIFSLLLTLHPKIVSAQQEIEVVDDLVRWSPDGMVVFVSDAALSKEVPQENRVQSIVYRQTSEDSAFEEVARLQRASTWEEFAERAGETLINTLHDAIGSTSDEELWEFIKENPNIENYGFIGLNKNFWRAFGTAFIDEESKNFPKGQHVSYRIRHLLTDGTESDVTLQGSGQTGSKPNILPPQSFDRIEDDSLVGGRWASPLEGSRDAFFGRIYRQKYPEGEFKQLQNRILAQPAESSADSILVYQWKEPAEAEQAFRYYIEPVDIVGNPGPPSDTLMVLSVDFDNLPLMGDVTAKDTTSGIHLSWEQIPNKPYLTGIEIGRSRNAAEGYITLDTLSTQSTEYLDTRLVPNQMYYYRFQIVTVRESDDLPSAVASASFRNETLPPSPPSGLKAQHEESGIRLNWDSVEEPDLFGYYVYRGTSRADSMVVVSRAIKDTTTFFDDSEELDGRTNYIYSIQAVNLSELRSELSNSVVIRPDRTVRPPEPVGLSGYAEQNRIQITWKDVRRRDQAVEGYNLYRGTSPVQNIEEETAASETAAQNGFEKINAEIITADSFTDTEISPGETYYYAVSSVDLFGMESELSNTSSFTPVEPQLVPPSQVSARNITGGVELRWNRTHQDGAAGYRVYRRLRGESDAMLIGTTDLQETRFQDQNVSQGELYWYSVAVLGEEKESSTSREQSVQIR